MPALETSLAVEALLQSLETMAFVSLAPAGSDAPPEQLRRVRIDVASPVAASIEMMAPEALGQLLCANILGTEPSDPDAQAGGEDALRELMNVTGGCLFSSAFPGAEADMGLPRFDAVGADEWRRFIAQDGVQVLDADGHTIAIRLSGGLS